MRRALFVCIMAVLIVGIFVGSAFATVRPLGGGPAQLPVIGKSYDAYKLSDWCKGWANAYPKRDANCYGWRSDGVKVAFGETTPLGRTLYFGKVTKVVRNRKYLDHAIAVPTAINADGTVSITLYVAPSQARPARQLKMG